METNQLILELDQIVDAINEVQQMIKNFKSDLINTGTSISSIEESTQEEEIISKAIKNRMKFLNKRKYNSFILRLEPPLVFPKFHMAESFRSQSLDI